MTNLSQAVERFW